MRNLFFRLAAWWGWGSAAPLHPCRWLTQHISEDERQALWERGE